MTGRKPSSTLVINWSRKLRCKLVSRCCCGGCDCSRVKVFDCENGGAKWDFPLVFKEEVKNRGVHAAARGGNLIGLKELLGNCDDVLEYRDVDGSAILHAL